MASIYLIRHGQASFGTDHYDRLSDLGCRQAEVLGEYLETADIRFDAVYSGELQRQRKTAAIAAAAQMPETDHRVDPRYCRAGTGAQRPANLPVLRAGN